MLEVAVITVSDRAFRGEYQDVSGPTIVDIITESSIDANVSLTIVPDDGAQIKTAILQNIGRDYIITTGGTGISSRDVTPDVTEELCDRALPGVAEMLRYESYKQTKNAVFSRGYCGIREKTIIINFPGSVEAVTLCTQLILPIMEHGKKMLHGGKH
ncbi:MAG: MogA/MoaB family molybdenum cofactor biosynthesis protein [Candidatus Aminicenantes bacterium]|nr:MAG: MogA/MoaB family molybdenum cofactor biosynthesis protein [Candidatus Aminicenantes bacterium]